MKHPDELLILAPRGRDGLVIQGQLAAGGIVAAVASAADIVAALVGGTLGMAIIADEAMAQFDLEALSAALAGQPPWSDCPFLLLTKRDFGGWTRARITGLLGNVTVLERPLSSDSLVSSVRFAVRARVRQRGAEAYLRSRELAEAQVRSLAVTLEARVEARTHELTQAMAEQARVQQDLKDSEELYRLAIELGSQVPWSADADGALIAVGTRLDELLGVPVAPLLKTWFDGVHPHDVERVLGTWRASVESGQPLSTEFRLVTAAGPYMWFRSRAAPLLAADHKVVRWHGTLEDIDQQRRAEGRLQELQTELAEVSRLSAMGAMASILAHELNQPLTAIGNYVRAGRRLLEAGSQTDAIAAALVEADRSTVRAGEIVRRARELVSGASVGRSLQPIASLIGEAQDLAFDGTRWSGVTRVLRLDPAITTVLVDKIQVQQVLINLIRNAAEAMIDSRFRELSIETAAFEGYCMISVGDTGPGVASEVAEHLFDPFNSTKAEGMGIGLSISRTIVEAHGGKIWCEPKAEGGTIFRFTVQRGV